MYTLVIADDEEIARKAMHLLIQKEFPDILVVGLAQNGVELVAMVERHKPDIAIVDVNMPGLSGIDAIDLLCARGIDTRFIIHTAYSEFDYVQRALSLKIDAYILKPEKQEATVATIRKLCANIDEARNNTRMELQIQDLFVRIQPVMESEIMYSIFIGEPAVENFGVYCEMHAVAFTGGAMVTMILASKKQVSLQYADKKEIQGCLYDSLDCSCTYLSTVHKNSICLLVFAPQRLTARWNRWIEDLLSVTVDNLCERTGLLFRCGVGGYREQFEGLSQSYQESLQVLNGATNQAVKFYGAAEPKPAGENRITGVPAAEWNGANEHVRAALDYMAGHFDEDIALDDVVESIGLSPYYLSRLFKKELGQTFIESLTQIRMDEAVQLACNTSLPIREMAKRTGYGNPSYFCRVFKKHTGKTIGDFRGQEERR